MRVETGTRAPFKDSRSALFGRYEVVAKIGEGGTGTVFLARAKGEAGFERLIALKVIHWRGQEDPFGRALLHEAKIASKIHHPSVVAIQDFGSTSDGYYLVMEYVEGCTLAELAHRHHDARPPRLILPLFVDALHGLHAAHSIKDESGSRLNVVHRDISPQNLLIGIDGACRVTDFGIARATNLSSGSTRDGRVRGKPAYMSPEQVAGLPVDHRSDIFSAGVALWNALTGKKLFHGATEHVSMFNVLKRKVPRPSTVGLAAAGVPRCAGAQGAGARSAQALPVSRGHGHRPA